MRLNEIDPSNWIASQDYILDGDGEDILYNLSGFDGEFMHLVLDAIQEYVAIGGTAAANKRRRERH